MHGRGARVDQIGHRFGLHQIHAAIQHRAPREFTRRGRSRARGHAGGQHKRRHHVTAMRGNLHHLVARIRTRRGEPGDQRVVERLTVGMSQSHPRGTARLQPGRAKGARDIDRARPR